VRAWTSSKHESMFKDERKTQYSPLMTREEQVRTSSVTRAVGRRRVMGRDDSIDCD
jgi:hypothetical protein